MKYRFFKTVLCMVLALALSFSLIACGSKQDKLSNLPLVTNSNEDSQKQSGEKVIIEDPVPASETMDGYICSELDNIPYYFRTDSSNAWKGVSCMSSIGDTLFVLSQEPKDSFILSSFDTLTENWMRLDIDTENVEYPEPEILSTAGSSVWILFREGVKPGELDDSQRGYYIYHLDLQSGESCISSLNFWDFQKHYYLTNLIALDNNRALITNEGFAWEIDSEGNVLSEPELYIPGFNNCVRVGGKTFVSSGGYCELDSENLTLSDPILDSISFYDSSTAQLLNTDNESLYSFDLANGENTKIFNWINVVPSLDDLFGSYGLLNSQGVLYYFTDRLLKIESGQVPVKKPLTLMCFGNSSEEGYDSSLQGISKMFGNGYTISPGLKDAVIRFNNTDPEFYINIEPVIFSSDTERDKIMMELATRNDIDLIDTSILPEAAISNSLLINLLPYIDADESISRDDFIPALLNAMTEKGGLYEFTPRYGILTLVMPGEYYPGDNNWNTEALIELTRQNPSGRLPAGRERIIYPLIWASTAEFMDWESGTCNFDNPVFASWLELIKLLPMEYEDWTAGPPEGLKLFEFNYDFSAFAGASIKFDMGNKYKTPGFPGAEGCGSYYIKLGSGIYHQLIGSSQLESLGSSTKLGIMASSYNISGAWRFMRTFIRSEKAELLNRGIPVLKEGLEDSIALEYEIAARNREFEPSIDGFDEHDEAIIRELTENIDKMVNLDTALVDTILSEINTFLGGKGSAQDCANIIQSKVSIYMAEHG